MDPNAGRFYREPTEAESKSLRDLFDRAAMPEDTPPPRKNIPKDWPRFGVGDVYMLGEKKAEIIDVRHGYLVVATEADFRLGGKVHLNGQDFYVTRVMPPNQYQLTSPKMIHGKSHHAGPAAQEKQK